MIAGAIPFFNARNVRGCAVLFRYLQSESFCIELFFSKIACGTGSDTKGKKAKLRIKNIAAT